jgi:hypothetical protein
MQTQLVETALQTAINLNSKVQQSEHYCPWTVEVTDDQNVMLWHGISLSQKNFEYVSKKLKISTILEAHGTDDILALSNLPTPDVHKTQKFKFSDDVSCFEYFVWNCDKSVAH